MPDPRWPIVHARDEAATEVDDGRSIRRSRVFAALVSCQLPVSGSIATRANHSPHRAQLSRPARPRPARRDAAGRGRPVAAPPLALAIGRPLRSAAASRSGSPSRKFSRNIMSARSRSMTRAPPCVGYRPWPVRYGSPSVTVAAKRLVGLERSYDPGVDGAGLPQRLRGDGLEIVQRRVVLGERLERCALEQPDRQVVARRAVLALVPSRRGRSRSPPPSSGRSMRARGARRGRPACPRGGSACRRMGGGCRRT